ncbi:DUF6507 family protein [Nocardiopsis sp. NPDC058631]|uniref:DUF6507 family protein n=1 Tax=Nocardiopsis sp. NPDC058631 TaxID=3346566 RepID=UPI003657D4B5
MSAWDIDVHGVALTLTDFSTQLGIDGDGFSSTIDTTADGIDMALTNAKSPPVESALGDFLSHFTSETNAMFTRSLSCLQGANDATLAYDQGQQDMAATAQSQAGTGTNLDLGSDAQLPPGVSR